jgi:hypothetical protein
VLQGQAFAKHHKGTVVQTRSEKFSEQGSWRRKTAGASNEHF